MPESYEDLDQLIDERIIVKLTNGDKVAGILWNYEEDFALTFTGTGQPNDVQLGDLNIDYVDGELILNGSNVTGVEEWERPRC